MRSSRSLLLVSCCLAPLCWGSQALAETPTFALDRFHPAPAGDPFFGVEAPVAAAARFSAQLIGSYARSPLALSRFGETHDVVRYQAILHAGIAWEMSSRLKLDLVVPVTAAQDGDAITAPRYQLPSPEHRALGQPRVGARVVLIPQNGNLPAVSLTLRTFVPVSSDDAYSGSDSLRYEPSITLGALHPSYLWSASVSRLFRSAEDSFAEASGSEVRISAAIALRTGPWQAGPEWYSSTVADGRTAAFARSTSSAELLLAGRFHAGPFSFGLAAGPGFTPGIGTPAWRALAGVSFSTAAEASPVRSTTDPDRVQAPPPAPPTPEPRTQAAALVRDRDGDTVPDQMDACPDQAGDPRPAAPRPGCPASDQDADGIADADDRCPAVSGVASVDPALHGCPADTDRDGVPDAQDACPSEKGPKAEDPKANGCPTGARILGPQIVIQQQILFETGSDKLLPQSIPVVQGVADLLREHPDIARIAVDGHTDNAGAPAMNLQLSQRRAVAIVRWLIAHGIDDRRVEARAFGPRRPIADNATEEGRAKNRRVEFLIRRRTPKGEAGWVDGPVD